MNEPRNRLATHMEPTGAFIPGIRLRSERNRAMLAAVSPMSKHAIDTEPTGGAAPPHDSSEGVPSEASQRSAVAREPMVSQRLKPATVDLVDTITSHIVPRLVLAHRVGQQYEPVAGGRAAPTAEEVASLVDAICAQDVQCGLDQAERMLRDGLSFESVLLDWVTAAARLLGELWLEDEKTFAEVTLGMGTLHRMLNVLRFRWRPLPAYRGMVILLVAPCEQHTLAVHLLGDLLRRSGWEAVVKQNLAEEELVAMVSCEPAVMLGISATSPELLDPMKRMIGRARKASLNRDLVVMLGGAIDLEGEADDLGAIYCRNIPSAMLWLERHARISL